MTPPVLPRRDEPPAALASMASFGLLLSDRELGALGDWCCDLAQYVERIAALDPALGLLDGTVMVADARKLVEAGAEPDRDDTDTMAHG